MDTRGARAARGTAAAIAATFLAALSHSVTGGDISVAALAFASIGATFVCIALAGKTLSIARLGLGVLLSQGLYHALFAFMPEVDSVVTGAAHHGATDLTVVTATHVAHHGLGMWAGHVIAAILTTVALGFGESVLFTLLRLVRFAVDPGALFVRLRPEWPSPLVRVPRRVRAVLRGPVLAPISRRGPPVFA